VTVPSNLEELCEALHRAARHQRTISITGHNTKRLMGGAPPPADEAISTAGLNQIIEYEPRDLTISVEAGVPWRELTEVLAKNRQMIPLDPPFAQNATVGGVIATNSSGPRRRLYGTARDVVIGMQFATVEGKAVQSGGMVVKNVAGLDMGKLMIGSLGTLAAIAVVNFKVLPAPEVERSFLLAFPSLAAAVEERDRILTGPLQPAAIDLLNPAAGVTVGNGNWLLAIRAGGNAAAVNRYEREFAGIGDGMAFENHRQEILWRHIQEFTPAFLESHPAGAVVRVSCTLKETQAVMGEFQGPAVARAGNGVCYGYFEQAAAADAWLREAAQRGWRGVIEFSPVDAKASLNLWPSPGADFEIMRKVKGMFDPSNLLNRGRLYHRI
jgi:glycolate oxidase FAD binding subunit